MGKTHHGREDLGTSGGRARSVKELKLRKSGFVPLGHCWLTLSEARDPVVTPSGHVYSKESLLQYYLDKKKELKRLRKAYEEQKKGKEAEAKLKQVEQSERDLEQFEQANASFRSEDEGVLGPGYLVQKRKLDYKEVQGELVKKAKLDTASKEEKLEELRKSSPWLTRFTPSAEPKGLSKPAKRPPSPVTGGALDLDVLAPVHFTFEAEKSTEKRVVCAVSKKVVSNHPAVLIKPSKIVVLQSVFDDIIKPSMTCPVSSIRLLESDILPLATSHSS